MEKMELLERYVEKLIKEKSECIDELKISDIENEIQCVADIAKLVYREENTPTGSEQEYLLKVINALVTATAHVFVTKIDGVVNVEIFDSYSKKTILNLSFIDAGQNLYFLSHQLNL